MPNYIDSRSCKILRDEVDYCFHRYEAEVQHKDDKRLFGIDNVSSILGFFGRDKFLAELCTAYLKFPSKSLFTLGGILESGNFGSSGSNWHRDAFYGQFKSLLYLTDVDQENGPFEIIPKSHYLTNTFKSFFRDNCPTILSRITEDQVSEYLYKFNVQSQSILGSAGTLVIFDPSTIHRGKPIVSGRRISLTNYYYPSFMKSQALINHFKPNLL